MAIAVDQKRCKGCEDCAAICPTGAIRVTAGKASVRDALCVECCACIYECPVEAITLPREDFHNGKD